MRPGTFHMVMTISDSLSVGGMYYDPLLYDYMQFTQLQLHVNGQRICNSDYPGAQNYLFQLVGCYWWMLFSANCFDSKQTDPKLFMAFYNEITGMCFHSFLSGMIDYFNSPTEQGCLPPLKQLIAITLSVSQSYDLTPQQNEDEITKRWPPGYKLDRSTAQTYTSDILTLIEKKVPEELWDLKSRITLILDKMNPNRRQRDLREVGESLRDFYHDNEHEYCSKKGRCSSWVGDPPGDEESAELSDGEAIPSLKSLRISSRSRSKSFQL
jgi:hypothetical protein